MVFNFFFYISNFLHKPQEETKENLLNTHIYKITKYTNFTFYFGHIFLIEIRLCFILVLPKNA